MLPALFHSVVYSSLPALPPSLSLFLNVSLFPLSGSRGTVRSVSSSSRISGLVFSGWPHTCPSLSDALPTPSVHPGPGVEARGSGLSAGLWAKRDGLGPQGRACLTHPEPPPLFFDLEMETQGLFYRPILSHVQWLVSQSRSRV